jgi:uncharacterized Zn finger protein
VSLEFSPAVLAKAEQYLAQGKVEDLGHGVWQVQGSAQRPYRVLTDADPATGRAHWIQCDCRHGVEAGGGRAVCSHAAAVIMSFSASSSS